MGIEASRVKTGLSQAEFASVLGISLSMLQDWETDRVRPDPIAEALFALIDDEPARALRVLTRRRSARRLSRSADLAGSPA